MEGSSAGVLGLVDHSLTGTTACSTTGKGEYRYYSSSLLAVLLQELRVAPGTYPDRGLLPKHRT